MTPEQLTTEYEAYKVSKCSSPARASATRISDIGHPCTAYLAFTRIAGEQRSKPDPTLACIFDEGHNQERAVMQDLQGMGYSLIESQRAVYWDKFEIVGHPDTKISKNGFTVPLEIKSVAPYGWQRMNSESDIREHKSYWYSKWIAQIQLYMLLESCEEYWLVIKNKSTGQIKIIPIKLDLAYAEQFVKKAENVKAGVGIWNRAGKGLEWDVWLDEARINDADICTDCPFKHECLPNLQAGEGAMLYEDPEYAEKIARHEEIKPIYAEYNSLHDEITDNAKVMFQDGHTQIVCGDWLISGKAGKRKGCDVPKEIKDKYAIYNQTWETKISRAG